ncbi:MAG: homocysteine S-methyltransferase family protein [Solirubrobacterales bacterium]
MSVECGQRPHPTRLPSPERPRLFLGDGGLETTLIYREGVELPCFAAFVLLREARGREALRDYYAPYLEIARRHRLGFTLDTPTWRANRDWGEQLGYDEARLAAANRAAVALAEEIRAEWEAEQTPIAICGTLGPRGDAYLADAEMDAGEAERYHGEQIATFAGTAADAVAAYTLPYAAEATGIVRAAAAAAMPVTISFTVETDGRLPSGQPLGEAIEQVDEESGFASTYFMVNCAHPTHFAAAVEAGGPWLGRLGGVRANASRKSHAELDEAEGLDAGDPDELGRLYAALRPELGAVRVLGGCCGTDHRHVGRICEDWLAAAAAA